MSLTEGATTVEAFLGGSINVDHQSQTTKAIKKPCNGWRTSRVRGVGNSFTTE